MIGRAWRHRYPRGSLARYDAWPEAISTGPRWDVRFLGRQRYKLEAHRDTLMRELARLEDQEERAGDGWEAPPGGDGVELLVRGAEAMLKRKLDQRLRDVERALEKLDEGTYGMCDATGQPIPVERLESVPETINVPVLADART
jgi:DnaK suppressor protein